MEENSTQNTNTQPGAPVEYPKKSFPFKWLSLGVGLILIIIVLSGVYFLNKNSTSKPQAINQPNPTSIPVSLDASNKQTFLKIPKYGVKIVLGEEIKDAYYLPETASKGYIYLKVHSLDSEPKCKSDPSSTAAIARLGKNDTVPFDETREEFMNRFPGSSIGDNYYYIDLAQYACADSATGRSLLEKVRKEFSEASKTIQKL